MSTRTTLLLLLALLAAPSARAGFEEDLARVDQALRENPNHVMWQRVKSCQDRRRFAIRLYELGKPERADRSLRACFALLGIPEEPPVARVTAPTPEELEARARQEIERALSLEPDHANGLAVYRECAACHTPEGFGLYDGAVPQIAGQHRQVLIKQLADIRAGNRDAVAMMPYASAERIGGAQAVADVAAYIDSLEISVETTKGPGDDLELGRALYEEHCVRCHGASGEGNAEKAIPRIQSQHYGYLVRQFEWIRDGRRRNADPEMASQIEDFGPRETHAVLDWVSRLQPLPELVAPPGWKNPDFATADAQ